VIIQYHSCMRRTWNEIRTWDNAKRQLEGLIKADKRPKSKIFSKAGLSRAAYYKTFSYGDEPESKMRKSSIEGLAKTLNVSHTFFDDLPYFGNVLLQPYSGTSVKEIVSGAIDIAGSVELLAEKTGIPLIELISIIEPGSLRRSVSVNIFHKIVQAAELTAQAYSDHSIEIIDGNKQISRIEPAPFKGGQMLTIDTDTVINDLGIADEGLSELLNPDNRKKHAITQQELNELFLIQESHDTNGTVQQWLNILYSIRGLNLIQD
jgi:hypothetical protein